MRHRTLQTFAIAALSIACAHAAPRGFTIPEITVSPNKRFGVLVPDEKRYDAGGKNSLVEVATGRVLAVIKAEPGMEHMNHGGVDPTRWSADSSLLLWRVDGKWFPRALVLIKLNRNTVQWQLDLLATAQQEILARTRKAAPEKYAAAKEANEGNGSAYPDGFTIDVMVPGDPDARISSPVPVEVTLTSNPKGFEDIPASAQLKAALKGEVDAGGKFNVVSFELQ